MAKQKLTQVSVQGLATNPNPNALPAGSCAELQNAVMRRPGLITPTPAFITRGSGTDHLYTKLLYSDFNSKVLMIADDAITPVTLPSTFGTPITTMPSNASGGTRAIVMGGPTSSSGYAGPQTAFSHFRSFVTEHSGVITNLERWAGLPPPAVMLPSVHASSNGFLLDGNAVAYRAHFSIESTDPTKAYIVDGPVSAVGALVNDSGSTCGIDILAYAPITEPFVIPTNCKLYINIYRSTQAAVTFVTELADDFRRVAQIEITSFTPTFVPIFTDEVSDDARALGLPLYTNNIGQEGGQASKFAPPSAHDICVFKDTMFYANSSALATLSMTIPGAYGDLLTDHERATGIGVRDFVTASTTLGSPVITFTSASEVIGIVPGQKIQMTAFNDPSLVVSVNSVAKTVTMNTNALVTAINQSGAFYDMIKVTNGSTTQTARVVYFDFDAVVTGSLPGFRMLPNQATDINRQEPGVTLVLTYTWPAVGISSGFSVCVTNGQNYYPAYTGNYVTGTSPLKALTDTRPNRVFYSVTGLPEAVPPANYKDVGSGSILKMWASQSALFVFCTDGLWKITGDGSDFSVYQIDPTALLVDANAVTSLNNLIYAWITDGIATITEDAATTISTDAVGPLLRSLQTFHTFGNVPATCLTGDSFRNEVWFNTASLSDEVPSLAFESVILYNDDSKNFSTQSPGVNYTGGTDMKMASSVYAPNVSRPVFLFANYDSGKWGFCTASDYDTITDTQYYLPLTVWFNPLQTEDKGNLKQWMDVNFFTANYTPGAGSSSNLFKGLFSAKGDATDATDSTVNVVNLANLSRDIHFWVPRRTALSDQQQIGLTTSCDNVITHVNELGPYIEVQGFTMRYRIASDTLKK